MNFADSLPPAAIIRLGQRSSKQLRLAAAGAIDPLSFANGACAVRDPNIRLFIRIVATLLEASFGAALSF
eukprot:COSAG02_NODE_2406_length_8930_cov_10.414676_11_plen_70_part_00